MKYRQGFLDAVERYTDRTDAGHDPTEVGLAQFFVKESTGKVPDEPDRYFLHLVDGKKWFEWTLNWIANQYGTAEWPGWFMLAKDFADDPAGFRQLQQRVAQKCRKEHSLYAAQHTMAVNQAELLAEWAKL